MRQSRYDLSGGVYISKMYASFTLLIILFLGLCLRLYHLGSFSLWFDEALIALQARNLVDIWQGTVVRSSPPLYYTLLHYWLYIGNSEFILRLLSTIFGILSILVIYGIGKTLFDRKIGLISAFLLATSPFHIYYSQEVHMYTIFPFLILLPILFLTKILKKDNPTLWFLFIVSASLSLYTHYFAFLSLFAENVFFFGFCKRNRNLIKKWLIAQGIIFLLFLPWLRILLFQHLTQAIFFTSEITPKANLKDLFMTLKNFTIGYHATRPIYLFATLLFFILFVHGIFSLTKTKRELYLLLYLIFIPIIITFLFSQKFHIYINRFLIPSSLTYYIIVACGISHLKRYQSILLTIIIFLLTFALRNHYLNIIPIPREERLGAHHRMEYREGANFIKSNFQQGDIIIHSCVSSYIPFKYYLQGNVDENYIVYPEIEGTLKEKTWGFKNLEKWLKSFGAVPIDIKQVIKNQGRVWLIFSDWDIDKIHPISHEIKRWLDNHCIEIDSKEYFGLKIYLYLNYIN